jgi:hypothetical protein
MARFTLSIMAALAIILPGSDGWRNIHKRNLLKARVVICSYNDHVRLLSPSLLVGFATTRVYSGVGADIVMESITLIDL